MKISINAHSSIRVEAERRIHFDPYLMKEAPQDAEIIFFTHSHYDHFSPEDAARAAGPDCVYVAPKDMEQALLELGIPRERIVLLAPGEKTEVRGLPVEAVPAYNIMKPFHPKKNGWLGYVVEAEGKRIYVCGDTDRTADAALVNCQIALIPVGGTYTMNAKEGAKLALALQPELAIPTHYGSAVGKMEDGPAFEAALGGKVPCQRLIV